jgi:hypothetical protein
MRFLVCKSVLLPISTAQAAGFVLATGLHPLVSENDALLSECLCLRLALNRMMSLMQGLLSKADI